MKVTTKPILLLRPDEKFFLEDLKELCETEDCESCPLKNACIAILKNDIILKDLLEGILDVTIEDKGAKR